MPTPAAPRYNLRMILVAIFAELVLIFLRLVVLAIERATPLLCAPIYILIQFAESQIGDIGSQQLTKLIPTATEMGKSTNSCQLCK
jgi:predicted MFS family arabinose efflux permease